MNMIKLRMSKSLHQEVGALGKSYLDDNHEACFHTYYYEYSMDAGSLKPALIP